MYIPFDEMKESSRVWIYQANRSLPKADQVKIHAQCINFMEQWAAHGQPLRSSFQICYDKFLIISVDESLNGASGCSIDASVALIKQLEKEFDLDFFDRTKVCFLMDDEVEYISISSLKSKIEDGAITEETLTFNNLVENIKSFNDNWQVEAKNSWLKRYF